MHVNNFCGQLPTMPCNYHQYLARSTNRQVRQSAAYMQYLPMDIHANIYAAVWFSKSAINVTYEHILVHAELSRNSLHRPANSVWGLNWNYTFGHSTHTHSDNTCREKSVITNDYDCTKSTTIILRTFFFYVRRFLLINSEIRLGILI